MNKELVSKPYTYIDEVKATLVKEQTSIVDTIKKNNEKYMSKIKTIEVVANKQVKDASILLDQFRLRRLEIQD